MFNIPPLLKERSVTCAMVALSILLFAALNAIWTDYPGGMLRSAAAPYLFMAPRWLASNGPFALIGWVTALFVHSSVQHLATNMTALFLVGGAIEKRFGWATLLKVFFAGGIAGELVAMAMTLTPLGQRDFFMLKLIGASPGTFALIAFYLFAWRKKLLTPLDIWNLEFPISLLAVGSLLLSLGAMFGLVPTDQIRPAAALASPDQSVWAHVGGYLLGLGAGWRVLGQGIKTRPTNLA